MNIINCFLFEKTKSWVEVVKATANIAIPPPPPAPLAPRREVLRLGGNEYAVYKAKKLKEKTKKEDEKRKKYFADEKTTEEFWYKQLIEELDREYEYKLEESFPKEFENYINRKKCNPEKMELAREVFERLMLGSLSPS